MRRAYSVTSVTASVVERLRLLQHQVPHKLKRRARSGAAVLYITNAFHVKVNVILEIKT